MAAAVERPLILQGGEKHKGRADVSSSKSRSVNQLEQNRALRNVQSLHKCLKMPVPQLPAVLAYLRWLDRMEAWTGRKYPASINEVSAHLRERDMYSWSGEFGNPIVLPRIKKHPDPEKYRSCQVKKSVFEHGGKDDAESRRKRNHHAPRASPKVSETSAPTQRSISDYYRPEAWNGAGDNRERRVTIKVPVKSKSAHVPGVRNNGKPTPFYVHAKNGFKYWPPEIYKPSEPPTRYSFGDRFNPGRAGVITDRIYARPGTNFHYWSEFQQHQNPIGSGNVVAGKILKN